MLGHPERGEKLNAEIDAARARLHAAPKPPFATALLVNRGGYTAGERSLAAALLAEAGLKPPAGAPPGYGGYVPLEKLLVLHPDVIVLNNQPRDAADQGSYNLTHPALNAAYPPSRRIVLPTRYTLCGGSALIAAFDYLTDAAHAARPVADDAHQLIEPVGERGRSRLQDHRRLDLVQLAVAHRRDRGKPGRAVTFSGTNFLPHHEPMMMSGAAAITSSAETMRSLAFLSRASAGNTSMPPAASTSSDTHVECPKS